MAGIQYKRREFAKILRKNGFEYVRSAGGHDIYKKGAFEASIPVKPNAMMCQRYIKEFGLVL